MAGVDFKVSRVIWFKVLEWPFSHPCVVLLTKRVHTNLKQAKPDFLGARYYMNLKWQWSSHSNIIPSFQWLRWTIKVTHLWEQGYHPFLPCCHLFNKCHLNVILTSFTNDQSLRVYKGTREKHPIQTNIM